MMLQLFELAGLRSRVTSPPPDSTYLNGGAAYYRIYRTADGRHVALGAIERKFWHGFCTACGHPEWTERQSEPLPQHALIADVAAVLITITLAECMHRFGLADCCLTPVLDLNEAVATPHHRERRLLAERQGTIQALFPAWFDGAPPHPRAPLQREKQCRQDEERA